MILLGIAAWWVFFAVVFYFDGQDPFSFSPIRAFLCAAWPLVWLFVVALGLFELSRLGWRFVVAKRGRA